VSQAWKNDTGYQEEHLIHHAGRTR